jgi:hypothetical protein
MALQLFVGAEVNVQFWAEVEREQESTKSAERKKQGRALTVALSHPMGGGMKNQE